LVGKEGPLSIQSRHSVLLASDGGWNGRNGRIAAITGTLKLAGQATNIPPKLQEGRSVGTGKQKSFLPLVSTADTLSATAPLPDEL
jgi:hypothetical protein